MWKASRWSHLRQAVVGLLKAFQRGLTDVLGIEADEGGFVETTLHQKKVDFWDFPSENETCFPLRKKSMLARKNRCFETVPGLNKKASTSKHLFPASYRHQTLFALLFQHWKHKTFNWNVIQGWPKEIRNPDRKRGNRPLRETLIKIFSINLFAITKIKLSVQLILNNLG